MTVPSPGCGRAKEQKKIAFKKKHAYGCGYGTWPLLSKCLPPQANLASPTVFMFCCVNINDRGQSTVITVSRTEMKRHGFMYEPATITMFRTRDTVRPPILLCASTGERTLIDLMSYSSPLPTIPHRCPLLLTVDHE